MTALADRFRLLEAELGDRSPEMLAEARSLAAAVADPLSSGVERCWEVTWEKPLYANTKITSANAKRASIAGDMAGAWRTIGLPGSGYEVAWVGKGMAVRSFEVAGDLALRMRSDARIAPHRMFAIQGAAAALRAWHARQPEAPFAFLAAMAPGDRVSTVMSTAGKFWGHTTAMHLLTDVGLCCKADIWLVRTALALGLVPGLRAVRVPTLPEALAITEAVEALAVSLHGGCTPQRLRYLDKVLMELSRQGILPDVARGRVATSTSVPRCQ